MDHISQYRFVIFAVIMLLCIAYETLRPKRERRYARGRRWPANFGIGLLNSIMLYGAIPITAVAAAIYAEHAQWGLFHIATFKDIGIIAIWAGSLLFLDFSIYLQHVLFHKIGLIWPYHAMHHSDEDLDASSGIRFHPIEVLISAAYKVVIIIATGIPVGAVITFEILLSSASIITHMNTNIPRRIDRTLRMIFVTPDMHRIHHSTKINEQNSNFGFCLSIWDRLCGTYKEAAQEDEYHFPLGLKEYQKGEYQRLIDIIKQPFRK